MSESSEATVLDPKKLYTTEAIVFSDRVKKANLKEPIKFGVDANGNPYVTDGNSRAVNAFLSNSPLLGQQVSTANFDVTKDPDFHPISEVKISNRDNK